MAAEEAGLLVAKKKEQLLLFVGCYSYVFLLESCLYDNSGCVPPFFAICDKVVGLYKLVLLSPK
jgi:hypothetical protein